MLTYNITYNGDTKTLTTNSNSITLVNGTATDTMTSTSSRVLHCKNKVIPNRLYIGDKVIYCDKKRMIDDITIDTVETCNITKTAIPSALGTVTGPNTYNVKTTQQDLVFIAAPSVDGSIFLNWSCESGGTLTSKKLVNLLNPSKFTLDNVSFLPYQENTYAFSTNTTAMVKQPLDTPIVNHKYYGRCYQKTTSGFTVDDDRFEYFGGDGEPTKNIIFAGARDTVQDNAWHLHSKIRAFTALEGSNWCMRSFVVNGTVPFYRKEMMILDLTETFGSGNEPDKSWCDENIPYFEGEASVGILTLPASFAGDITVKGTFELPIELSPFTIDPIAASLTIVK